MTPHSIGTGLRGPHSTSRVETCECTAQPNKTPKCERVGYTSEYADGEASFKGQIHECEHVGYASEYADDQ